MSMVSWFHRFRGVDGFIFSCVFGFIGFMVSMFSWFHRFRGVKVSWFHRVHGVKGFMV